MDTPLAFCCYYWVCGLLVIITVPQFSFSFFAWPPNLFLRIHMFLSFWTCLWLGCSVGLGQHRVFRAIKTTYRSLVAIASLFSLWSRGLVVDNPLQPIIWPNLIAVLWFFWFFIIILDCRREPANVDNLRTKQPFREVFRRKKVCAYMYNFIYGIYS